MRAAPPSRRRFSAPPSWLLAPVFVLLTAAATVQQTSPYRRGETIAITGTVSDAAGAPVEGMTVVLLAAHQGFKLRGLRRVEEGPVRVPTRTDTQGRFRLEWRWEPYYDIFRIRAEGAGTAPGEVATGGGSQRRVLAEIDLGRRILEGSPVVVALAVAGAGTHRQQIAVAPRPAAAPRAVADPRPPVTEPRPAATDSRPAADPGASAAATQSSAAAAASQASAAAPSSAASAQSDDERRVFDEMGKPDRVDRLEMPGGDETAWWYFERGKSFHFRGGRLDQVMEFDPVQGR